MKRVHGSHGLKSSDAERHCACPPAGLRDMTPVKPSVSGQRLPRRPLRRVPRYSESAVVLVDRSSQT